MALLVEQEIHLKTMSRKYVIINTDEVGSVNFSQVDETSADTVRYNVDGTKTFVKFDGETTPSFLDGKTQYTHSEILAILATDEWSPDAPF